MSRAEITHTVTRGTFYLGLEKAVALVSGILYFALLLRWLGPTKYGIMTLALSFAGLATTATGNFEVFLERYAAEYHARGRLRTLRDAHYVALAMKLGLGIVAAAVLLAAAPWTAVRFDMPELRVLLPILALFVACDGLSTTGRATLFGLQQFRWVGLVSLVFHLAKTAMVGALWFTGKGLAELAVGLTALTIAQGVASQAVPLWMLRRPRDAAADGDPRSGSEGPLLRQILAYSIPLLGARITFLSGQNLGKIILGAMFSPFLLGYFSFVYQTIERFVELAHTFAVSMLPTLTRLVARGEHDRLRIVFDRAFRLGQVLACVLALGLLLFAREITLFVGSPLFAPAIPLLQVMALVPVARTAQQPLTMLFQALRRPGIVLVLAALKFVTELAGYLLLVPAFGLLAAGAASVAGAVVSYGGALIALGRVAPEGTSERARVLARSMLLFAPLVAAAVSVHAFAPTAWSVAVRIALALAVPPALFALGLLNRYDLDRLGSIPLENAWMRRVRDLIVSSAGRLARRWEPRGA